MDTDFNQRLEKLASRLSSDLDHWASHIILSIWEQNKKYGKLTEKQIELVNKVDGELDNDILFRQEWDTQKAADWKKVVDYYSRGPYYSNITRKARTNPAYIPTRNEFDKLVNNKYAQKFLKNSLVPAKFDVGDLVQIRKNRSWYSEKFAMILEDKGVMSHVEGGRGYLVQFLDTTENTEVEERDLKIMRQSAVDKKAKEKDNV